MSSDFLLLTCGGMLPSLHADADWGAFTVEACADLGVVAARLGCEPVDAVLVQADDAAALARLLRWPSLLQAARDAAVIVCCDATPARAAQLLALGVQDVRAPAADDAPLARALRLAIERHRRLSRAREGGGSDLDTGLPQRAQLLEHLTQLVALREREPAPMAVLVLRLEGLSSAEAGLGVVSAQILRRKAAVRLRAALRASDVVASVERDTFVVLLAWIDQPADAPRVAAKLVQALERPLRVAGHEVTLRAHAGVALYPAQGGDAEGLLRVALHEVMQGGATSLPHAVPAANDDTT